MDIRKDIKQFIRKVQETSKLPVSVEDEERQYDLSSDDEQTKENLGAFEKQYLQLRYISAVIIGAAVLAWWGFIICVVVKVSNGVWVLTDAKFIALITTATGTITILLRIIIKNLFPDRK